MLPTDLNSKKFLYQPYYCEENIWHLCQHEALKTGYVIFIASKGDAFPMLNQKAMANSSIPIFWDYHVILLALSENNQIIDFDTTLPFVSNFGEYFHHSFLDQQRLDNNEAPFFKLVPIEKYITLFSSDRSHMKSGNEWLSPPPNWPSIGNNTSNFSHFIDMNNNEIGEVLSFEAMFKRFS